MIKKLSAFLLLATLFMVNGIYADADMAEEAVETTKVNGNGKKRVRKSSYKSKKYSDGDVQEGNEIVRVTEGGAYRTRSGSRHYHGRSTSCSDKGCRMCTHTCAEEPVCKKVVCGDVFAPACAHKSTVIRYTCPPDYQVTERVEADCAPSCAPRSCNTCN